MRAGVTASVYGELMHVLSDERESQDVELLWWLVELGRLDRDAYRDIRELMWAFFVENSADRSRCSDKPSN